MTKKFERYCMNCKEFYYNTCTCGEELNNRQYLVFYYCDRYECFNDDVFLTTENPNHLPAEKKIYDNLIMDKYSFDIEKDKPELLKFIDNIESEIFDKNLMKDFVITSRYNELIKYLTE